MTDFKTLDVWRIGHELTCEVYRTTRFFPKVEQYGLVQQIRRAGVSIGANIAEGCGRGTDRELAHSASIALGSANELQYLLFLSVDLGFLVDRSLVAESARVCRMLGSFRASVRRRI